MTVRYRVILLIFLCAPIVNSPAMSQPTELKWNELSSIIHDNVWKYR
jgi:hypothetical protein